MNHDVKLTSMEIKFNSIGFVYLYGPFETELVKNNYLIPSGYAVTEESLVYPPTIALVGKKDVLLRKEQNSKEYNAQIEILFFKKGFQLVILSVPIAIQDYSTISTDHFSIEESNFSKANVSLQELCWNLTELIFGTSHSEMFFDITLNSDRAEEFCRTYGIKLSDFEASLTLSSIITVDEPAMWEKIKKIELERADGGSVLKNTVFLPNFDTTLLSKNPDIHILHSSDPILFANDKILENTFKFHIGILYQTSGLIFLKYNVLNILVDFQRLKEYYNNHLLGNLSWVYVDKTLASLENRFEDLISQFELSFSEIESPNYVNYQDLTFKDKLNKILGYTTAKSQYQNTKKHLQENFSSLRAKVSDKGEKEEKMAYNRIVTVIGFLAGFQVVSEILPVFNPPTVKFIRVAFLVVLIPFLLIIWYYTSYNNKKKIKIAEKLAYKSKILKQKQLLVDNLPLFKNTSFIEQLEFSQLELDNLVTLIEKRIQEIDNQLAKIE